MQNRNRLTTDNAEGVIHRHSTLFGFVATLVLIVAVGAVSHWSAGFMLLSGLLGMLILPRCFYGLAASRALDKETPTAPVGIGFRYHMWDAIPTEEERLEKAIQASQDTAPMCWARC